LENIKVDHDALFKYHAAILIQMSLVSVLFWSLDWILSDLNVPYWAIIPLFYGLSLKSRVLNPLNNARPTVASGDGAVKGFQDRILPSWTPPGIVFPLVWILIMSPLRAVASALVWEANGHVLCHPAFLALSFHLCVGDVWNTVNNAEQRFGGSVTGVLCVTATAVWAAVQYYEVTPLAGHLLGLTLVWLSIASSLVTATWKLNAPQDPLYPVQREGSTTQFQWRWLESNNKE
jgi:tryptophan-rich sensory protein